MTIGNIIDNYGNFPRFVRNNLNGKLYFGRWIEPFKEQLYVCLFNPCNIRCLTSLCSVHSVSYSPVTFDDIANTDEFDAFVSEARSILDEHNDSDSLAFFQWIFTKFDSL